MEEISRQYCKFGKMTLEQAIDSELGGKFKQTISTSNTKVRCSGPIRARERAQST